MAVGLYIPVTGGPSNWLTPGDTFLKLGNPKFDTDVAGPAPGCLSYVPAKQTIWRDSLLTSWASFGFVWMNAPYNSDGELEPKRNGLDPWLDKFTEHGNGVAITPDRTSAPWFQKYAPRVDLVLFWAPKIKFLLPPDGHAWGLPSRRQRVFCDGRAGLRGFGARRQARTWTPAATGHATPAGGCGCEDLWGGVMRAAPLQQAHYGAPQLAGRAIEFKRNIAQKGDALDLLASLHGCTPLVFLDPQYREVLDKLAFGNEGTRQRGRARLPAMTSEYIDGCHRESAHALAPSGYLMRWMDTYGICEAHHLRVADCGLKTVDLIAWDNLYPGMGKRSRRRGDYLLILQKPPITPSNWRDHGIPSRWPEKVGRSKIHPHTKPIGLITRLIGAVTQPGDLVIDPAAGSFVVMHAALGLGREFIGVDLAFEGGQS